MFFLIGLHMYAQPGIILEKTRGQIPLGLSQGNKTYKLKGSMLEFRARSVTLDLKFVRTYLCPDIKTAIPKTFDNQISAQVRPGRSYT